MIALHARQLVAPRVLAPGLMLGKVNSFHAPLLGTWNRHFASRQEQKSDVNATKPAEDEPCVIHFKTGTELLEKAGAVTDRTRATQKVKDEFSPNEWTLPQPVWSKDDRDAIEVTHHDCNGIADRVAYGAVFFMRKSFDILSGFTIGKRLDTLDEQAVLKRIVFLETVAGVPPMMAAMVRHLQSLRLMRKDGGWIHTLLEEAENERMHLMIAMTLKKTGPLFRFCVLLTQLVFCNVYFTAYLISPRFCHRFVGFLEEEAVKTYTFILQMQKEGKLPVFDSLLAPKVGIQYYHLPQTAMIADVLECMRADEAHHRDVNHVFADLESTDTNPIKRPDSPKVEKPAKVEPDAKVAEKV